jgi:Flp pilus assembly CpaE family ATPase
MYPLKAVLVGDETKLETARQQLLANTVEIEASVPDIAATIAWLSQAPEARRLFVVYLAGSDPPDGARRLRSGCVGQPILAVIGEAEADKEQLIRVMRAGIDQAVLLPLHSADFRAALESLSWQFGYAAHQSLAVAVVGVTPGSGVTTVAVNLAHEIAHIGRDCILAEAATRMGKLAGELGVTPRFTTRDLATAGDRLDVHMVEQALIPVVDHLRLLAAPVDAARAVDPGGEIVHKMLMFLRQLAEVNILETSYNLTESYYEGLAAVDQVLVLGRHTPDGLEDLKLVCHALRHDHGVRTVYPVVNRFDRRNRDLSLAQMQDALQELRVLTIAADRSLTNQSMTGLKVLEQRTFGGATRRDIQAIARLILGESPAPGSGNSGVTGWLKRMFASG